MSNIVFGNGIDNLFEKYIVQWIEGGRREEIAKVLFLVYSRKFLIS